MLPLQPLCAHLELICVRLVVCTKVDPKGFVIRFDSHDRRTIKIAANSENVGF